VCKQNIRNPEILLVKRQNFLHYFKGSLRKDFFEIYQIDALINVIAAFFARLAAPDPGLSLSIKAPPSKMIVNCWPKVLASFTPAIDASLDRYFCS
jgi:hypothetical protein